MFLVEFSPLSNISLPINALSVQSHSYSDALYELTRLKIGDKDEQKKIERLLGLF